MLLAVSPVGYVLVIVGCIVVAALLGGSAFSRWGNHMEEHGGRGERIPEPPGFRKPPSDGGLL
ncbi:MAG: hypothetical protein QOE86_2909 [Solirubrobacteraceae bacterium]|jgi:hypothetical protein|nr:hypothetical protein [Solirubrobacteraceae bacterium]